MNKNSDLNLAKAFSKEGARLRFRKLVGLDAVSDDEIEDMLAKNDGSALLGHLCGVGQPVFSVDWGALWHGSTGRFEIYHFDGHYFAKQDYSDEVAGPFDTALEAAEWEEGIFNMDYDEGAGTSGSIQYTTEVSEAGEKLISARLAVKLFETITGHVGGGCGFYWCEAEPGKLFKDPFHGDSGKALMNLYAAQKEGGLDAVWVAQLKFQKLMKKDAAFDLILGEEAKHFTSAFDSFLMKVPLGAKGKLAPLRAEWIRMCQPRRIGKKTLVTVIPIANPMDIIEDLVAVEG